MGSGGRTSDSPFTFAHCSLEVLISQIDFLCVAGSHWLPGATGRVEHLPDLRPYE